MFYKFSEKPSVAFLLAPFSTVPPSLKSENGPSCVLLLAESVWLLWLIPSSDTYVVHFLPQILMGKTLQSHSLQKAWPPGEKA